MFRELAFLSSTLICASASAVPSATPFSRACTDKILKAALKAASTDQRGNWLRSHFTDEGKNKSDSPAHFDYSRTRDGGWYLKEWVARDKWLLYQAEKSSLKKIDGRRAAIQGSVDVSVAVSIEEQWKGMEGGEGGLGDNVTIQFTVEAQASAREKCRLGPVKQ